MPPLTPLRWPDSWTDPSTLTLLDGAPFNFLFISDAPPLDAVRRAAQSRGIASAPPGRLPASTLLIQGEWPGIRVEQNGEAPAGPTGEPWLDSNGWRIRLARAQHPSAAIWVDAPPSATAILAPGSYELAVADAASRGGRWIASLAPAHATALAGRNSSALPLWSSLIRAAAFFAVHSAWDSYQPAAVAGVLSDFAAANEFPSAELLNLLDRAGLQVRIIPRASASPSSLHGLRALISLDSAPPAPALAASIAAFVRSGAMLIALPNSFAPAAPAAPKPASVPRFSLRPFGSGAVALWTNPEPDPYLLANDAASLISHRYDLVRFWNSGAAAFYYTWSPGRSHALVHLLSYSTRPPSTASLRIAGRFRRAALLSPGRPVSAAAPASFAPDGAEFQLSEVPPYLAIQLTV